jgi:hypothetical protein
MTSSVVHSFTAQIVASNIPIEINFRDIIGGTPAIPIVVEMLSSIIVTDPIPEIVVSNWLGIYTNRPPLNSDNQGGVIYDYAIGMTLYSELYYFFGICKNTKYGDYFNVYEFTTPSRSSFNIPSTEDTVKILFSDPEVIAKTPSNTNLFQSYFNFTITEGVQTYGQAVQAQKNEEVPQITVGPSPSPGFGYAV